MKHKILKEELFFSMTWDYLNVYLSTQHRDSPNTVKSYEDALTVFRRYVTDVLGVSIEKFRFDQVTYDFMLDYRIYLVDKGYKARTVNHRLTVVAAYMKYAATRRTALFQVYLNISEVPEVVVPSRIREVIEDKELIKKTVIRSEAVIKRYT